MNEKEVKVIEEVIETIRTLDILPLERLSKQFEERLIALERGLEAILSKIEASASPGAPGTDEPGWFGVPE